MEQQSKPIKRSKSERLHARKAVIHQRRQRFLNQYKRQSAVAVIGQRLFFGFIAGLIGMLIGGFFDGLITLMRSLMNIGDGQLLWLFSPLLAILGLILGLVFASRSGEVFVNMFNLFSRQRVQGDIGIASDIMRGIGLATVICVICWFVVVLFF